MIRTSLFSVVNYDPGFVLYSDQETTNQSLNQEKKKIAKKKSLIFSGFCYSAEVIKGVGVIGDFLEG